MRSRVVFPMIVLVLAIAAVATHPFVLPSTHAAETSEDTAAILQHTTESLSELQETDYTYRHAVREPTNSTDNWESQDIYEMRIQNSEQEYHLLVRGTTPPLEQYGTAGVAWDRRAHPDSEWKLDRSLQYDSDVHNPLGAPDELSADEIRVVTATESTVTVRVAPEAADSVMEDSLLIDRHDGTAGALVLVIDTDESRIESAQRIVTAPDGTAYQLVYKFEAYGTTEVERPDELSYTLRELVYRLFAALSDLR